MMITKPISILLILVVFAFASSNGECSSCKWNSRKCRTGGAGAVGPVGTNGTQGPIGQKGDQGMPGVPGIPGSDGIFGENGIRGEKGDKGVSHINKEELKTKIKEMIRGNPEFAKKFLEIATKKIERGTKGSPGARGERGSCIDIRVGDN